MSDVLASATFGRPRSQTIGELGATTYPEATAAGVMTFVHTARYSLELAPPDMRARVAARRSDRHA